MFQSLRSRLWLTYMIVGGSALAVVGLLLVIFLIRNPMPVRRSINQLQTILANFPKLERPNGLTNESLLEKLKQLDESQNVRLLILNRNGDILLDSRQDTGQAVKIRLPSNRVLNSNKISSGTLRDEKRQLWLYAMRPIGQNYILMAAIPRPAIPIREIINDDLFFPLLQGWIVSIILAVLLSTLISRWIAAPLQKMVKEVNQFVGSSYQQVPLEGPKEVQELAGAFNDMVAKVINAQKSQRDFVANVSHELKTPLTSIQGFAQAMLDGTIDSLPAAQQAAKIIHVETGRMHRLVLDLLELARLDSGTAQFSKDLVYIDRLLNRIVDNFNYRVQEKQLSIDLVLNDLPVITGDGDRLFQVFTNLVENAVKHSPQGGNIKITARVHSQNIVVSITDDGPGIPLNEQPRVFERFYQLDEARTGGPEHGIGLGLAIAAEIIRAHRGKISIKSNPGQGSTFVVQIPVENRIDNKLS